MRALLLIFLLGTGGAYWLFTQAGETTPPGKTAVPETQRIKAARVPHPGLNRFFYSAEGKHPCVGKRYCLVSYMAPWCPYCKRSLPAYNRMRSMAQGKAELGVVAVLSPAGRGFDNATALAERINGPVYRDRADRAWSAVKARSKRISGTPGWAMYDGRGELVASTSGAVMDSDKQAVRTFLEQRLGMQGQLDL